MKWSRGLKVVLCVTIWVLPLNMTGQTEPQPLRFSGGGFAGVCASQVHGDQESGFNKFGWSTGAFLNINWSLQNSMQLGLLVTQKGSRRVPDLKNGDHTTWRYRFTYFDIPLMRVWHPDPTVWWFGLGIQPSILLSGEEDFYSNGYSPLSTLELHAIDIGGIASVGYHGRGGFGMEARLTQSFIPISPRPEITIPGWHNFMMNMAIQMGATWTFGR